MENNPETYAHIIRNNPFWEVLDSQFEVLSPQTSLELTEIIPPDSSLPPEAYYAYGLIFVIAIIWLIINKKAKSKRESNFPKIYFDQEHQWYWCQINEEEPSLMTADEPWLPKNYHFDINQEGFYQDCGDGTQKKVSVEDIRKAALSSFPAVLFPILLTIVCFLGTSYLFILKFDDEYKSYLAFLSEQEYQISLFDPFEGMCKLNTRDSLIPQQMTIQIVSDLAEGRVPPITVEEHLYLEGDVLSTPMGEFSLPTQLFLHSSPDQIIGSAAQNINFRNLASGNDNCVQGDTYIGDSNISTKNPVANLVPINNLKNLSLGVESGLYETKLFGRYDTAYLINISHYEIQTKQYRYSISDIPGCNSSSTGTTYAPGFMGVGESFNGEIVPWGTSPAETINVPDFRMCSSVMHLEYQL